MIQETELQWYMRQFYVFLNKKHKIQFKKLNDCFGCISYFKGKPVIMLDYRESQKRKYQQGRRKVLNPFSTFVHEVLHDIHPNKNETWIRNKERQLVNKMRPRQACNLFKRLAQNITT
jgi:hypothetical protein